VKMTYTGGEGPPSLIAKFAPVVPTYQFLCGSQALGSFRLEVLIYTTEFLTKHKVAESVGGQGQPKAWFAAVSSQAILQLLVFKKQILELVDLSCRYLRR